MTLDEAASGGLVLFLSIPSRSQRLCVNHT